MKRQIEIHTLVLHVTYWLEFETLEEQRATVAFLDGVALSNGQQGERVVPFYVIEDRQQQDALDRFLRELARAQASRAPDGASMPLSPPGTGG